jgi:hypothetical protein
MKSPHIPLGNALLIAEGARLFPREAPLEVDLAFFVRRPASASRRVLMPTKRPALISSSTDTRQRYGHPVA